MIAEIGIGLYPGILFGIRSYVEKEYTQYVLYVPFIDICITVEHEQDKGTT